MITYMSHPIKHFITITKHRHKVIRLCFYAGIFFQGLGHDLSKYSYAEFHTGSKYYQGTYSPNTYETKTFGFSKAWLHHKGRNKHHYEYWTYYSGVEKRYIPCKMPIKYVKEMLCDRIAATMIYNNGTYNDGMALEYYESRNNKYGMHEETAKLIESWLLLVKEKGYKEALKIVKKVKDY